MSDSQARLGLSAAGFAIGAYFGQPGLGLAVGSLAGSLLFPGPDPPPALGPRLGDLQTQVSAYGNPIPRLFGTVRIAGNVIWNSEIREIANQQDVGGGGKGGAPQETSLTFEYKVDMAISLCAGGPDGIDGLGRVWAQDKLYYDFSNPPHARGINALLYRGTQTQNPDPTIEADKGVGNVPAHRGLAYIVFRNLSLTPFNNQIPTFHFEVHANGDPIVPSQEIASDNGAGRVQFDLDTGLCWVTRPLTNKIEVYRVNSGLSLVCSISTQVSPFMLSYQPSFLAVNVDILGTVSTTQVPAKMWVASSTPDALGGKVSGYATDGSCRELDIIDEPFGGSIFCWPGAVHVDSSSISLSGPNTGTGPLMIVGITNGACRGVKGFGINPLAPGAGGVNDDDNTIWADADLHALAEFAQMDNEIIGLDDRSNLFVLTTIGGSFSLSRKVQVTIGFADNTNSLCYDPEEEMIYTKTSTSGVGELTISKYTKQLALVWQFTAKNVGDNLFDPRRIRYHTGIGDVWVVGGEAGGLNTSRRINKAVGGYDQINALDITGTLSDFQPFPGAPFAIGIKQNFPSAIYKFPLGEGAIASPPTLATVVTQLVEEGEDLTAADIDVTDLTTILVRGYTVAARQPIRNALQPLMQTYFFDAVESDDKIKFVTRGGSPVLTVPSTDMNARRDLNNPGNQLTETRVQETELPVALDLRYIAIESDYKVGVTNARRIISKSQQFRTQNVPIVLNATEARSVVDVLLHNIWFERTNKQFSLSKRYFALEPTDIINITSPDQGLITVRINAIAMSLPNLIQLEVSEEDISIYSGYVSPGAVGLQPQPPLLDNPPVVLLVMDTTILRDLDDNTGMYVTAYAIGGAFDYAQILQSPDGIAFGFGAIIPNEGAVGFAEEPLTWEGSFS